MSLRSISERLKRSVLDRWWATPLADFSCKLKGIVVPNNEIKPPLIGIKSYERNRKNITKTLCLDEVYAPRVYGEARVKTGNKHRQLCYDNLGRVLSYTEDVKFEKTRCRLQPVYLDLPDSRRRRNRLIYLSHVLTQCGLRENAIRPLWRLLRIGYKIRYTNFSRLVGKVASLCNVGSDFTRNLSAPAKGLRFTPRFNRDAEPLFVKGIYVPRWTYKPTFVGDVRDLKLD